MCVYIHMHSCLLFDLAYIWKVFVLSVCVSVAQCVCACVLVCALASRRLHASASQCHGVCVPLCCCFVFGCVRVLVFVARARACVRVCARACVRARMRVRVRAFARAVTLTCVSGDPVFAK